jgi:hypothetical protein
LPSINSAEHFKDILGNEMEAAIKSLKRGKAPGEETITVEMIQVREIVQ